MRKFRLPFVALILLCTMGATSVSSTEIPIDKDACSMMLDPTKEIIKGRFAGGLLVVRAYFNGVVGNYILDTGASHLFINQNLVSEKAVEAYGLGAQVAVQAGVVAHFKLGDEVFENQPLYKMDMRHLEAIKGCEIAGIIGTNLLGKFSLFVDYDQNLVRLEKPHPLSKDISKNSLRNSPLRWQGHFPMVSVSIDQIEYDFAIDTGAEANIFSNNFENCLTQHTQNLQTGKVWTISDSTTEVRNFTLNEMECLGLGYSTLAFMFSDIEKINRAYSVDIDGILGFPFLKRHPFTIDFKHERLIIWKG
jgi:hypothetical protein